MYVKTQLKQMSQNYKVNVVKSFSLNLSSSVINFLLVPSTLSAYLSSKARPIDAANDAIQMKNPTSRAIPNPDD